MMNATAWILVVEDEPSIRNNIVMLLQLEGFGVHGAAHGEQALQYLQQGGQADLVLSDVMMPVMDGLSLLAALRADDRWRELPLVFLTARGASTDMREGMNLGADDYVTKPFERDALLRTVRARLQRHAQLQSQARQWQSQAEQLQSQAHQLAYYDRLTRLPNRNWMVERLTALAQRQGTVVMLLLGLDGFGRVNDAFGRSAGDQLLGEIVRRLQSLALQWPLAGAFDSLCRTAGDEFALLLAAELHDGEIEGIADALQSALAPALRLHGQDVFATAGIGIARWHPRDAGTVLAMPQQAEAALRQAKSQGPGQRASFSSALERSTARRLQLHHELHQAAALGQLRLHYQPKLTISGQRIAGCEALMRWEHPTLGPISPAEFIPIAEDGGQIVALGHWAVEQACADAAHWRSLGVQVPVAVNMSAHQLLHADLPAQVQQALQRSNLPGTLLELELTESIAMHDMDQVLDVLRRLRQWGIHLSMDDFGTGYSSLRWLKQLPLDVLKVDQSFVRNLTTDPGDAAITRAVIALAHSFGMQVVAEGVETPEQLHELAELGCEMAQGYLFSRPLPAAQALDFFQR